jgi:hypothetical protein
MELQNISILPLEVIDESCPFIELAYDYIYGEGLTKADRYQVKKVYISRRRLIGLTYQLEDIRRINYELRKQNFKLRRQLNEVLQQLENSNGGSPETIAGQG